jgi:hypothetical protein
LFNQKRSYVGTVRIFQLHWNWISRKRKRVGRKPTNQEVRELIFRMVAENRTWGAPRIHGELRMLGFNISERTVLSRHARGSKRVRIRNEARIEIGTTIAEAVRERQIQYSSRANYPFATSTEFPRALCCNWGNWTSVIANRS